MTEFNEPLATICTLLAGSLAAVWWVWRETRRERG